MIGVYGICNTAGIAVDRWQPLRAARNGTIETSGIAVDRLPNQIGQATIDLPFPSVNEIAQWKREEEREEAQ